MVRKIDLEQMAGQGVLYHRKQKLPNGKPVTIRLDGALQVDNRLPNRFQQPVRQGQNKGFINNEQAVEWQMFAPGGIEDASV